MLRFLWLLLPLSLAQAAPWQPISVVPPSGSPPAYTGVGDAYSGASAYGSCTYAYNASFAASLGNACLLQRADLATCTVKVAATGLVDYTVGTPCAGGTQTAQTWCNASSPCAVVDMYDQTGNGNTMENIVSTATQPKIAFNAVGSGSTLPCVIYAGGQKLSNTTLALSQPFTFLAVAERTGAFTSYGALMTAYGCCNDPAFDFDLAVNRLTVYGGAGFTAVASDSVLHAMQVIFNGASGAVVVDGTQTPGNIGTGALPNRFTLGDNPGGGAALTGYFCEHVVWPTAPNVTQQGDIHTNVSARYATP